MMSNDVRLSPDVKEISHPRFAAFYNRMMAWPAVRRGFESLRRETAGQAHGIVLEVVVEARRRLADALVPIRLSPAPVESLPFPDAHFDSVVVTLVFCSVRDPERGLREIWRVLKPGGTLLLLEHVRAQGRRAAWVQDALVPLTTRCMGNCHWNRDTLQIVLKTGFRATQVRQLSGGLQPMLLVQASRPQTPGETDEGQ